MEHEYPFGTILPEKQEWMMNEWMTEKMSQKFVFYIPSSRIFRKDFL